MRESKIWQWFDDKYNVYTANINERDTILAWTGTEQRGIYKYPDGGAAWDILIPGKLLSKAKKFLKIKKISD